MAQHISIRVPWHDSDYSGCVCNHPARNIACRLLKNIASKKNDEAEERLAGCPIAGRENMVPCVGEGAAFMSPDAHTITIRHPYKKYDTPSHSHYLDTELHMPPFSAPARPFGWTLLSRYENEDFMREHGIRYEAAAEPDLGFKSAWVQGRRNQQAIFKAFFGDVVPSESLCIFYAKKTPFVDDTRRVVIGIGLVDKVIPAVEYRHAEGTPETSMTWETMVCHSIRPDNTNGVLFPYRRLAEHARTHPDFDVSECTVFVEDEHFNDFSYASEHVTNDAVISVLLNALKALRAIARAFPAEAEWNRCIQWTTDQLHKAQINRGAFPSLGPLLYAFGFEAGYSMASSLRAKNNNPWRVIDAAIDEPARFFEEQIARCVTPTMRAAWSSLQANRKAYLELLSRITLTYEQAKILLSDDSRRAGNIFFSDDEALDNPYILYERTRHLGASSPLRITPRQIDRALFLPPEIADCAPLPQQVSFASGDDRRRIRAYTVSYLEDRASQGHTVYPASHMLSRFSEAAIEPPCAISRDVLNSQLDYLTGEVHSETAPDGELVLQLNRLREMDDQIELVVRKRTEEGIPHNISENWEAMMDASFGFGPAAPDDTQELMARREKSAALEAMAAARLFVLIGGAGTGKTTLLSLLCKSREVAAAGVTLLAPTGKARVKMSEPMQKMGVPHTAYTVAQFLMERGLFDGGTGEYRYIKGYLAAPMGTVIVDECSMLTEEMMGSLMLALGRAERIILVGDPKQLPPIGAGRPFVDLVNHLAQKVPVSTFPRVGTNFAELQVPRRQRDNLQIELAQLFRGVGAHFDESLFDRIDAAHDATIVLKRWQTQEEFEALLLETLVEEIPLANSEDREGFGLAMGGTPMQSKAGRYLAYRNDEKSLEKLDDWQILTPIYGLGHGAASINHLIHERFRNTSLASFGSEGITYGDKIINSKNSSKPWVIEGWKYGQEYYIANGEIGYVSRVKKDGKRCLVASFATQPGISYDLTSGAGDFEGEPTVELAYALTVHKVQGSGFEKVVLVMGEPCRLITRELLYTAITRQTKKLVILYNDEPFNLAKYASDAHSEIAKRITRLFAPPAAVEVEGVLFEDRLIHRTIRGELVRSKSEVIIANELFECGIAYDYEKPLIINGVRKVPDFTIHDANTGRTWYWEHLGMLRETDYRNRWDAKRAFYAQHGIVEGANLIVTSDGPDGSIDSLAIRSAIDRHLR